MSRHGTDRNPAQTLRKALDAFERLAGVMPRVVSAQELRPRAGDQGTAPQ